MDNKFSKYQIKQAIEYLELNVPEAQKQALSVLIWNYYKEKETTRLLSESIKQKGKEIHKILFE